ncbi:unnamed protein product, partial [Brenthis ino]
MLLAPRPAVESDNRTNFNKEPAEVLIDRTTSNWPHKWTSCLLWRTALILLLASGRRIHDLTLLDDYPENLIFKDNKVILWPRFGSKTDNQVHRESGWLPRRYPDPHVCPVRHNKDLIIKSQSRRNSDANIDTLQAVSDQLLPQGADLRIDLYRRYLIEETGKALRHSESFTVGQ